MNRWTFDTHCQPDLHVLNGNDLNLHIFFEGLFTLLVAFCFFFVRSGRAYTKWIPCTISRSDTFWRNDGPHNRTCVNVRQQVLILWTYWWACLLILLFFTLFVLAWASSLFNKELVDYLLVDHLIVIIGKIFHVCFEYVLYILAVLM